MAQRRLDEFSAAPDGAPIRLPPPPRPDQLPGIWQVDDGYIRHPLIEPRTLLARPFQLDLARIGVAEDLLLVLPTGMGKTVIAALVAAEVLRRGTGKILFVAPTRPLVDQHADSFAKWLGPTRRARFMGSVRAPVREGSWEGAEVVFATPQIIVADLTAGRYDLSSVALLVVDEAHRAVGRYAYVPIAERFRSDRSPGSRLLALTASPGGELERIEGVVATLGVTRVEARHRTDEGVQEFVPEVKVETEWVQLTGVSQQLQDSLRQAIHDEGVRLQRMGFLRRRPLTSLTVTEILHVRAEIFARPGPMVRKFGPLLRQQVILHLSHAMERLETQGVGPFLAYLDRVEAKPKKSRADSSFLKRPEVVAARTTAAAWLAENPDASHPKIDVLRRLVAAERAVPRDRLPRILIFAQYRDTIESIVSALQVEGVRVERFVGQSTRDAGDKGMSQKEQHQVLDDFRHGRFEVMVASSVAEEGIDIPDVDVVVFFEAVPSEIRAIQRRGRTGRNAVGRVVILLTEGTRDIGYQKAEVRREASMVRVIRGISRRGRARAAADKLRDAAAAKAGDKSIDGAPLEEESK
ncbi:MAG: DEAD/DEAH box helicase [Thermoplasmata archaeon]|nr:DEAD/DEAH box helicase [Thermoplasmata archaeon]